MTLERIPAESWRDHKGHVTRYEWVRQFIDDRDSVLDVCCGVGYGAVVLGGVSYSGIDREPADMRLIGRGWFSLRDVNDDNWSSDLLGATHVVAFEAIEHVADPARFCKELSYLADVNIFVSVPVVPTKHLNPHHLHDFTVEDIPPLFPRFRVADEWAQPDELSHVWRFIRC